MVVQVARPRSKKRTAPRLPRKVKTALADFQRRLLNLFPDDILAIILYGSYARGQAAPDSDVDVLVVVNWSDPQGKEKCYSPSWGDSRWEKLTATANRMNGGLAPLVVSENEFKTNLPVVQDARREGVLLWRKERWAIPMEEEEHASKPHEPQTWIDMAEAELKEARQVFEIGLYRNAVSTAYYAMFYAARAALLTKKMFLKKHSAAQAKLTELLVSAGELEEKYVTYLAQAETARETSAYQPYIPMSHGKAKETLEHAEEFIAHVKKLLAHKEKRDEENQA